MHRPYRGVEQLEARRAHNPEVVGSSPTSATTKTDTKRCLFFYYLFGLEIWTRTYIGVPGKAKAFLGRGGAVE